MKKVAHYRRAILANGVVDTLSGIVDRCFDAIPDNLVPIFDITGNQKCMLARRGVIAGVRFLHFVCYEEGAPVAVINTQIQAAAVEADEQNPEGENEYIQAQLFCLLTGNNVLWSSHNEPIREGRIHDILSGFILCHGGRHEDTHFGFQVILDQAVVQRVFEEGIQEIDLDVGAFAPTLERAANGGQLPEPSIIEKLGGLLRRPATHEQLDAAANIEAKLILRPGHDWNKPEVKSLMITMSNNIRETYDDEFAIVTKSGLRLTRDKMSLKRDCDVQGNKRVVNSIQMEIQMREVLAGLRESRIINE